MVYNKIKELILSGHKFSIKIEGNCYHVKLSKQSIEYSQTIPLDYSDDKLHDVLNFMEKRLRDLHNQNISSN